MKPTILTILAIALFALPLASAVSLNDSILNATGLPLQINVTAPIYFTELQVNESWIYFKELRTSESATEFLTFNMTTAGDYLGTDLPYFSASTATSKTISSNIYLVNVSTTFSTTCNPELITHTEATQSFVETFNFPSCTNGLVTLNLLNVKSSTLTIDEQTEVEQANSTIADKLMGIVTWLGILIVVSLAFLVISFFTSGFDSGKLKIIGILIMTMITAAIALVIGIIIINSL